MKYALLLAAALVFGCQDKPDAPGQGKPASGKSAPAGSPATKAAVKRVKPATRNALLDAERILRATPKQADIALATANAGALIKAIGREEIIKAIPEIYAQGATELRRETGYDLFDPAQWANIGIDASGPGGMFVLTRSLTIGFVASVSDKAKFQTWLSAQAPSMKPIEVNGASVYMEKYGPTLVLTKDTLSLYVGDRNTLAKAWGLAAAGMTQIDSLANDARVAAGAKALGYGGHVGGFVDFQRTVDAVFGLEMRQANPDVPMLMTKARAAGKAELADRLNRFTRGRGDIGEQMAVGAIKGMIFGQMGPMSLGVEIEGAAVRMKADLGAGPTALPRRLLSGRKGVSPIATLAGPKGALAGDIVLDMKEGWSIAQTLLMTGGGGDFVQFQAALTKELGISLVGDILPAFTGEIGGSMLLQDMKAEGEKRLGATGFASVDPPKLRKVLDAVANHPAAVMFQKKGEGYVLNTPWRNVEFVIKGTQLIISTDPTAFDRAPGRSPAEHLGPTLSKFLAGANTSLTWSMDLVPMMGMFLLGRFSWDPPMPDYDPADARAKALVEKRNALSAEIKAADIEEERIQLEAVTAMVGPLGHIAATISETDTGLRIEGGLFTRGPYLKAVSTFATHASTIDARMRKVRVKARDLRTQRREIDNQLRNPRRVVEPMKMPADRELK